MQEFLDINPFSIVYYNDKVYKNIQVKHWNNEVLEKLREADRVIPKVSLHDFLLDDQNEERPNKKNQIRKTK
ncbi:MAG: hypothetical protein LBD75_06515 [Candidatus Peribacteria bacterium]|nr:hypothetical protein [Candidatus Peribacteria bacterium]